MGHVHYKHRNDKFRPTKILINFFTIVDVTYDGYSKNDVTSKFTWERYCFNYLVNRYQEHSIRKSEFDWVFLDCLMFDWVLLSSSPAPVLWNNSLCQRFTPLQAHPSQTVISFWSKVLKKHREKPKKKKKVFNAIWYSFTLTFL